jgi:hypothetical protein
MVTSELTKRPWAVLLSLRGTLVAKVTVILFCAPECQDDWLMPKTRHSGFYEEKKG